MRLKWSTSTSAIAAPGGGAGEARAQHLGEVPAVEQLGQRVHAREPLEPAHGVGALVLGTALGGDVAHRAGEQHAPVDHPDGRAVAHPARHAVHADEAVVLLHDLAVAPEQVGEAPGDVERGAIVGVHELVVAVDELLRLLGRAEQRRQARAVRVHDEALVGPALAAVEVLADDLGGVRERLARRVRLARSCAARSATSLIITTRASRPGVTPDGDDRGEALAVLAAEHDVVFAAADSRDARRSPRATRPPTPAGQYGSGGEHPSSSLSENPVSSHIFALTRAMRPSGAKITSPSCSASTTSLGDLRGRRSVCTRAPCARVRARRTPQPGGRRRHPRGRRP